MKVISAILLVATSLMHLAVASITPPHLTAAAAQTLSTDTVLTGLYNTPSFSILGNSMFLSGLPTASDAGSDDIYLSTYNPDTSQWGAPQRVFTLAGYHVSDPTVVTPYFSGSSYELMYFTILSNADAAASTTAAQHNQVGLAVSTDGGYTWQYKGIVIGQQNGIDTRGAWGPRAVVTQNEIWVYFSTNQPGETDVYRARFDLTGTTLLGTDRVLYNGAPLQGFFPDVAIDAYGNYSLFLNQDLGHIYSYTSNDGINWSAPASGQAPIIVGDGASLVSSPIQVMSSTNSQIDVYFVGAAATAQHFDSISVAQGISPGGTTAYQYSHAASVNTGYAVSTPGQTSGVQSANAGGSGGSLLIAGLGIAGVVGLSFLLSAGGTAASTAASSATGAVTGYSFGGRIIALLPCLSPMGPSVWVTIAPAGPLLPPFMYIWTPATLLSLVPPLPSIPPTHIGQEILGRFDIPFACYIPPFEILTGLRMQIEQVSPL